MLIKLRPNLDLSMASYFSLKPFTIFFFIFITITNFFLSSHCHGADNFTQCGIPYDCGDIKNVTFPFWGGSRPQFCGLQGFDLVCKENRSLIHINKVEYQILQLIQFNDEIKMTIAMSNSCSPLISPNATLDFNLFKFDPRELKNLTLIYDCSETFGQLASSQIFVPCGYPGVAYHVADDKLMEEMGPRVSQKCHTVQIPVFRSTLEKIMSGIFKVEKALSERFEVEYHAPAMEHCGACLGSGGRCGSNPTTNSLVCYCRDHLGDQYTCNPYRSSIPPQSSPETQNSKFHLFLFPSFFLQSQ